MSTRPRRPNSMFVNVAIAEENLELVTYEEASKRDKWKKAMKKEMTTLRQN
jgi:hypothetical protein